jgi:hypothetical protein
MNLILLENLVVSEGWLATLISAEALYALNRGQHRD